MLLKIYTILFKAIPLVSFLYLVMIIFNFLLALIYWIPSNLRLVSVLGFSYFYVIIWILIPCLCFSFIIHFLYYNKSYSFNKPLIRKHKKILLFSITSFLIPPISSYLQFSMGISNI